jgi:two-component system, cell cycle sensor histidine kinase and response regulator CckA
MENMLRRLIGEDVELRTRLAPGLSSVKADVGQLDQILMNLAVNARDAMPKGGALTIETGDVELDDAFVSEHAGSVKGPHVMLRVRDTGVGMPKEVLAHVFEPFFTTKEQGKGTGLGLATVYGIVKQNGGYVGVSSEPGKGTSFDIYLPRVAEAPQRSEETTSLMPIHGDERVLLVEDEAVVRGLARQTLKLHGYTVIEARDGDEALRLAAEGAAFDLLITDLIMPKMGGRDLARRLKEKLPGLPVLYMSGYSDDAAFREGGLEPGSALISKPFSPQQLLHKVRKTIRAAQRVTRVVAG